MPTATWVFGVLCLVFMYAAARGGLWVSLLGGAIMVGVIGMLTWWRLSDRLIIRADRRESRKRAARVNKARAERSRRAG